MDQKEETPIDQLNPLYAKDFEDDLEEYVIEPKKDFIAHVRPIVARTCHLCGYDFDFKKMRNPRTGKFSYKKEALDSREYTELEINGVKKKGGKSVLPEILKKLTDPLSQDVLVLHIEYPEPKEKSSTKK